MTFKCKMCGGEMIFEKGSEIAECPYCGTKQTLPKLQDEKIATLYERANYYRRNNEFDKAIGIFEHILNEDTTDAEAYWSLVLCRYGVEYVEDPATKKQVPTVHRAQFASIFNDEDYKKAIELASEEQKSIYEIEAKVIDDIQKNILTVSQKEEPFDVFICYKETDDNGNRTQDSVIANDLYCKLTAEGFKVFFARITLEDKLGSAYEPYIFAALNSAKVMVVLGTKPEHFHAVWVRNEWSRFLDLIKKGEDKVLIPAYKDMDAYSLPDEFAYLQSQDMSKIGFLQDLIHGIQKITKPSATNKSTLQTSNATTMSASNILKNKWMLGIIALMIILIGGIFVYVLFNNKPSADEFNDPSSPLLSSSSPSLNENLIQTKYFDLSVPDSWIGNYHVEMTAGSGYDTLTNEFEYIVSVYEKSGYIRNGMGRLFDIVLTTDRDYDAFADGGIIGGIIMDREYYIFTRYPTDSQFDLDNKEIYTEMSADVEKVINSISSEKNTVKLYSEETDEAVLDELSDSTKDTSSGIWVNGFEYDDCFEKEITIIKKTDTTVTFNIFFYRIWSADDVVANIKDNKAYFVTEDGVEGYLAFYEDKLEMTITKSSAEWEKIGTLKFVKN